MDADGEPILNEFDCPFLTFSNLIYCIPSTSVKRSVSVVHECSNTCMYTTDLTSKTVEHEGVDVSEVVFKHDWSTNLYCLNIYCMC